MQATARMFVFVPLFVVFELTAYSLPPMTWFVWELEHPDVCCLDLWQIVLIDFGIPALAVLVTHAAVALTLDELVRLAVDGIASLYPLVKRLG